VAKQSSVHRLRAIARARWLVGSSCELGIRARAAVEPSRQRGYRFDSSHSSKSNKKLIESVTPPDFTNEISKYQFHVTLFLAYLAALDVGARDHPLSVQVLDRLAENPKLEQNELRTKLARRNGLIIIRS